MTGALTIWQLLALAGACACAVVYGLDRLGVDLPDPLAHVAPWLGYVAVGLAGAVVAPMVGAVLAALGLSHEAGRRRKVPGSELPERPPVDEVEGSDEVSQHVDELADDVEGDGLADDVVDEVREGAGDLNQLLEDRSE